MKKIKILYIAGWGRSGSTLLGRTLGQIKPFFHGGELRTIWKDGLRKNSKCGCGKPLKQCEVWRKIFAEKIGDINSVSDKEMTKLREKVEPKNKELVLSHIFPSQNKNSSEFQRYIQIIHNLYQGIAMVNDAELIVDDSLHPGYASILNFTDNVELYMLHLVRDPRGCAYSWLKPSQYLGNYNIVDNALGWNLRNIATELLGSQNKQKYMRVFYEDFIKNPRQTVQKIVDFVGFPDVDLPFVADDEVDLGITHSVFGNPNRMKTGVVKLKLDEQWKTNLSRQDYLKVTGLCLPMMLRYGYPKK
ncbi:sulfotransferase domain-containing protein [Cyanobacterium stanieri LEGE 03274]|uniref:Sulfotransferase domain-containing protein n=1 Tax=Cyanobacterium stanieri LEGE 03274 TaxID=1828756 RepID=A0ABR9V7B5_9CHRO|nr:sulfotransferase domain-containing protein [Cyanobacterium stanieri]MBE9223795.1 sulfotransferase domain-containing protein [Cyanobacterium stanieri LEGE 03274]